MKPTGYTGPTPVTPKGEASSPKVTYPKKNADHTTKGTKGAV